MPPLTVSALRTALDQHVLALHPALPGRHNTRLAAVMVIVQPQPPSDLRCLLIQRAQHLRDHPGELGFPGGKPEPIDRSLAETALRETAEELGVASVTMLGRLSSTPLFTSEFRLEPFVGAIPPGASLSPAPSEVDRVVWISLQDCLSAPHTDAIPFVFKGETHLSPIFCDVGSRPLYGGSAYVLWELLQRLGTPPPLRPGRTTWAEINGTSAG